MRLGLNKFYLENISGKMKITAFYMPADIIIRVRSPCPLNRLIRNSLSLGTGSCETRCKSPRSRGGRRTRSKLALISWATQPHSQHNRSARTSLLETRIALGYT